MQRPPGRGGFGVGPLDRHQAGFEVERGGDAVHRLQPLPGDGVHVAVQIDEPGPDDEPGDVGFGGVRRCQPGPDGFDGAPGQEHVGDAVEPASRIDDPAAPQECPHPPPPRHHDRSR